MDLRHITSALLCVALAACGAEVAGSAATAAALQASQAQQAQAQQQQVQKKVGEALEAGMARAASAPDQ
jgi:hypothetical protein